MTTMTGRWQRRDGKEMTMTMTERRRHQQRRKEGDNNNDRKMTTTERRWQWRKGDNNDGKKKRAMKWDSELDDMTWWHDAIWWRDSMTLLDDINQDDDDIYDDDIDDDNVVVVIARIPQVWTWFTAPESISLPRIPRIATDRIPHTEASPSEAASARSITIVSGVIGSGVIWSGAVRSGVGWSDTMRGSATGSGSTTSLASGSSGYSSSLDSIFISSSTPYSQTHPHPCSLPPQLPSQLSIPPFNSTLFPQLIQSGNHFIKNEVASLALWAMFIWWWHWCVTPCLCFFLSQGLCDGSGV